MEKILECIRRLKKGKVKEVIDSRMDDFIKLGKQGNDELFKELCFCLLTANYSAEGGMRIQKKIGDGFLVLSEKELAKRLKELGHRFPRARANYIVEARRHKDRLVDVLNSGKDEGEIRAWLVRNIKGLGYKEASHFLRNVGFENLAILDFHIINLLTRHGLIEKPRTLSPKKYLEIEEVMRGVGEEADTNMAELDLYLWYEETGKVLK